MIVVMDTGATESQVQAVIDKLIRLNFNVHRSTGVAHTVLGGVGPEEAVEPGEIGVMPGVMDCRRIMSTYKLASKAFRPEGTVVRVGDIEIGGNRIVVMAGPCSVESEEQIEVSAKLASS